MATDIAVCPECSKRIRIKPTSPGKRMQCPACDHRFEYQPDDDDLVDDESISTKSSKGKKPKTPPLSAWLSRLVRMPMSMFVALMLVGGMASLRIADYQMERDKPREMLIFQLSMGGTVLLALLSGFRLGWMWARLVSAGAVFLMVFSLIAFILASALNVEFFVGIVFPIAIHLGILAALERPSTKEFFRLKCPDCKSFNCRAADFLFVRAKCQDCERRF